MRVTSMITLPSKPYKRHQAKVFEPKYLNTDLKYFTLKRVAMSVHKRKVKLKKLR